MSRVWMSIVLLLTCAVETYSQDIDLSNWKITIPTGRPTEVSPPEILDYASNEELKPFFYKDSTDGALVFYAYPASSTRNSSYSRTELREQMEPGSNSVNWTFAEGGTMRGTLSVPKISRSANGKYHRVIVMQIHGRLSNAQKESIGADDNNAPPILKIYWDHGKIRVKTKVLKDQKVSDTEILHEEAWTDDEGRNFKEIVGTDPFTLEVNVSEGKLQVTLNDRQTLVYDSVDIKRWGVFENYFKAGNYFQSKEKDGFALVKYYKLDVRH